MKIYKDKERKEEVIDLDLGIVKAGFSKVFTFWLYNDTSSYLRNIKCFIEHEEVEVLECPVELSAYTIVELKVKWSPNITLKQGLTTPVKIIAEALWG